MNTPHGPLPVPPMCRPHARPGVTWATRAMPWVVVMAVGLVSMGGVQAQEKTPGQAGQASPQPVPAAIVPASRPVGASGDPAAPGEAPATTSDAPRPDAPGSSSARRLMLVRASPVPLGENSVLSVGAGEAKEELQGLEGGLFRRRLSEPRVLSVAEQGGWVLGFLKEPKASRIWSFFNPRAPVDSGSDLQRSARIFGIRGDAPLPTSQVDPIHVEPVGIRFWQISR